MRLINKIVLGVEFSIILFFYRLKGISFIIGYLRNPNPKLTVRILRFLGAKVGERTVIKRTLFIDNAYEDEDSTCDFSNIEIGRNCYIGDCVFFDLANKIIIEDNSVISGNVSFVTHADCNRSEFLSKIYPRKNEQTKVKKGAWIGFGATLLAGSILGEDSVLAAHSLLNTVTEYKTISGGSPARKIKDLSE